MTNAQCCKENLLSELQPALGCTEPIAIAYATAKAAAVLGTFPEKLTVGLSGNLIKNAKSVTIPNSKGLKGMRAAAILGVVGGNADLELEVLSKLKDADVDKTRELLEGDYCDIELLAGVEGLRIEVEAETGDDKVNLLVDQSHLNIVSIEKNGESVFSKESSETEEESLSHCLTVEGILDYIEEPLDDEVIAVLERQIRLNSAIAEEGLTNDYGASVGKRVREMDMSNEYNTVIAATAAASDARMGGSDFPVVINSGSGNQGITVSIPVVQYARINEVDHETELKALALSNLVSIRIKSGIGALSAFCGAVSAAAGASAAMTYMDGGNRKQIGDAIVSTLANLGGVVCDGAKASCAAKIMSSVQAAIVSKNMALANNSFLGGDGLVTSDIERTIDNYGRLGKYGMEETDLVILDMMINDDSN